MERLTYGTQLFGDNETQKYYNKLKMYEDLDDQGRLLILPCAMGDTVYAIEVDEENFTHFHCPRKISEYKFNLQMLDLLGMFGRCIFLTREEAEAALRDWRNRKIWQRLFAKQRNREL